MPMVTRSPVSTAIRLLYGGAPDRQRALTGDPFLDNVWAFEQAAANPVAADFLDEASPYFPIKRLSTSIYRGQLEKAVVHAPLRTRALDAGCGIGRSTLLLSEVFPRVVAFDPCRANIDFCEARLAKIGHEGKELHWDGVEFLDTIQSQEFDFVLALEFVCYTGDPARTVAELARVLKDGGVMMLSVEATPGALIAGDTDPGSFDFVRMSRDDDSVDLRQAGRYVRLFHRESLASLCRNAGLDPVRIIASHFFGEGPFWQTVDDDRLRDDEYLRTVTKADCEFRLSPGASRFARVLTAVAIKPRKA
ncbi:MAG: class I SAM-dependent methyltransferase [Deltaproteobacteria bacterium]|nr:class I SAM-dependent methyltransferase [Deltaproteobacteria bacterium]